MRYLFPLSILGFLSISVAADAIPFSSVKERTFDYVIVGGGLSGLVVANRLSEDKEVSVLVIENGVIDDRPATRIPYLAAINTENYYDIVSSPEPFMFNKTWKVHVGNVVGGGSVVNGMQFDRGADADYDAWEELGNEGWGWNGLKEYFKKSTHFEGPSEAIREEFNITYDQDAYGNGPLNVSIPSFQYEDYKPVVESFRNANISQSDEGFRRPIGLFWTPNSIDNTTKERCHARKAYYDPVRLRSNLRLLINTHVDQLIFQGNKSGSPVVSGVKVTSNKNSETTSIFAKKEVILAAGAVFTPHILLLSGIGPSDVLAEANITIKKDLPAVGSNFQDHPVLYMTYNLTNQSIPNPDTMVIDPTFNVTSAAEYAANRTGPYTFAGDNVLAFLPLRQFSRKYTNITALASTQAATRYLPPRYSKYPSLLRGFLAQRTVLMNHFVSDDAAVGECTVQPRGRVATAVQKPLSRGTLTLNITHPHANPIVVRNAFQNPVDKIVLAELTRWARHHWTTHPILRARFSPIENVPGEQYTTDEEIFEAGVRAAALNPTFAHSSGGCALMPEELGGCVDSKLRVYGVEKLRVVDASILPLIPAAHLQATMYAVAEKAADIIKGD